VTAGPAVSGGGFGGGGGPGGGFGRGGFPGQQGQQGQQGGPPGQTGGQPGQTGGQPGQAGGTGANGTDGAGRGGGMGGLLNGSSSSSAMTSLLKKDASSYTWVAATIGANNASGYQLASEQPVMAIGGFNGSDPYPTLAEFEKYVQQGKIHYFIVGGEGGRG